MKGEFNILSLVTMAQDIRFQPALAAAVNRLLRTRNQDEYNIALKEATELALGYSVQSAEAVKDYGINTASAFSGVPLWQPLTLKATEPGEDDLLLDSAVVAWNQARNIQKTVVQGRDSSVKEFINNGDYAISINGLLAANSANYPLEQVVTFEKFMNKKQSIEIVHEVLNAIGVFEIVIESHDCPKTPYVNVQQYSISAVSDIPIPLQVNDIPKFL